MNIEDYIASGILEDYVLGLLDESERQEVEAMALRHPEIKHELDEMEQALGQYAMQNAIPLPDGLQDKILSQIPEQPQSNISENLQKSKSGSFGLNPFVIPVVLLVLCGYLFYENLNKNKLILEKDQELQACDDQNTEYQKLIKALLQNTNKPVILTPLVNAPDEAIAKVFYRPDEGLAFIDVVNLLPPEPGKQYQVWALKPGSDPIPVGLIENNNFLGALTQIDFVENVSGFAISKEPTGGSPQPTSDQIYLIGNI